MLHGTAFRRRRGGIVFRISIEAGFLGFYRIASWEYSRGALGSLSVIKKADVRGTVVE